MIGLYLNQDAALEQAC